MADIMGKLMIRRNLTIIVLLLAGGGCHRETLQLTSTKNEIITDQLPGNQEDPFEDSFEDSFEAYKVSLYPLVAEHCGGCHGKNTSPLFATDDKTESFNEIVNSQHVDLKKNENSRIYLRLFSDGHNCWSDCKNNAKELLRQIRVWSQGLKENEAKEPGLRTQNIQLIDVLSKSPTPQDAALVYALVEFDLSSILEETGARLTIEVRKFDEFSYEFKNPQISTRKSHLIVKSLRILVEDEVNAKASTYAVVDEYFDSPGDHIVSEALMIVPLTEMNNIAFAFETLEFKEQ
jgi:hypothetical protein